MSGRRQGGEGEMGAEMGSEMETEFPWVGH